ncbi:MAG: DNA-directed RNA polymerase subunit beta' [Abditibacteriota bacterium]|nr:DNA-directed RNA polymerase subunit beta' [Abditibacteriota bacterium]
MTDANTFDKIRIGIASPDDIRKWSKGEVKKPETINYRTFKPERDGLFCERIFGPVKDWECHCGRYKKVKFKGIVCDRCGVEVTRSKVRRERMGHIELAAPVSHIWYQKGVPSPMSVLLDMTPRSVEKVLYFASYIVVNIDKASIESKMDDIRAAVAAGLEDRDAKLADELKRVKADYDATEAANTDWDEKRRADHAKKLADRIKDEEKEAEEDKEALRNTIPLLEGLKKFDLITEEQYRAFNKLRFVVLSKTDFDLKSAVKVGVGGEAIKELLSEIDVDKLVEQLRNEVATLSGPKRTKAIKRLEVAESFQASKSRPEWMILDVLPVISPELRPMVQLDGGRFAASDLNDLYRRIINRNNRLKKEMEVPAPSSIINHEKRLLQEAVDALIDNGRRSRPVVGSNNRQLKSLSDMLKGKEGRFRKNLLGKRVDYSGRSVIVVGPSLKLHQCGLPRYMALELFKPFVIKTLVEKGNSSNIKSAKHMIDRMNPVVWDALEEVVREHPVMLNRAPTLHKLGIQAFEPILVDGKAIQLHPLVCSAFNADFDGDQMAVHVPLSASAQAEARCLMLSTHNLFSPADGRPIVSPSQDMVLGSFFMTMKGKLEDGKQKQIFADEKDAILAYESGKVKLHEPIDVRLPIYGENRTEIREITAGRILFNRILPENMRYVDKPMDKKSLGKLITECYAKNGHERTVILLDDLKDNGYKNATTAGMSISMTDMDIPSDRDNIVAKTQTEVEKRRRHYSKGLITDAERKEQVLNLWTQATNDVAESLLKDLDDFNSISIITTSGARGSKRQITQLSGMRGLMSDPFGNLIEDLPIKSNFHEGLSVLEYFVSTHGARKGLADTALRTADAGYLTRRLVDVSQEVIVRGDDCGTTNGVYVSAIEDITHNADGSVTRDVIEKLSDRLRGRTALEDIFLPGEDEPFVKEGEIITDEQAVAIEKAGVLRVGIRSPLMCELRQGVCAKCYGRDMGRGVKVEVGTAVGIIAAQSIGEPGTQLTMRTFHTGGVAGKYLTGVADVKKKKQESLRELHNDINSGLVSIEEGGNAEREKSRAIKSVLKVLEDQVGGLLRVVELFEARSPKGQAIVAEVAGTVMGIETGGLRKVLIHTELPTDTDVNLTDAYFVEDIIDPRNGEVLVKAGSTFTMKVMKKLRDAGIETATIRKTYLVPYRGNLEVEVGQQFQPGDRLTEGPLDPHMVLKLHGVKGVMEYLVREIQSVYKSQGVDINDKHVETIIRQMLKKRRVVESGDSPFLPGQIVDKFDFDDVNAKIRDEGGTEATADWVLLGITEASLATDSFLSAASFQKTTRVLTDAAVKGKRDDLVGLKENVIIGRLIPAGTGLMRYRSEEVLDENGEEILMPEKVEPVPEPETDTEESAEDLTAVSLEDLGEGFAVGDMEESGDITEDAGLDDDIYGEGGDSDVDFNADDLETFDIGDEEE